MSGSGVGLGAGDGVKIGVGRGVGTGVWGRDRCRRRALGKQGAADHAQGQGQDEQGDADGTWLTGRHRPRIVPC